MQDKPLALTVLDNYFRARQLQVIRHIIVTRYRTHVRFLSRTSLILRIVVLNTKNFYQPILG